MPNEETQQNTPEMGGEMNNTATPEQPMQQQNAPAAATPAPQTKGTSRMIMWGAVALVVIALIAGAAYAYMNDMIPGLSSGSMMMDDDTSEVVATVNGEKITQNDVEEAKAQQAQASGGESTTTDEQILEALIANALVMQDAAAQGVAATKAEIDQQIEQVKGQFDDEAAFDAALADQGVTMEEFRKGVADQLTIQKYLLANIDTASIAVTEEEIQAAYDQIAEVQDDIPTLEDVSTQIESLLLQQKQQQLVNELVTELRADADVEVSL